MSSSFATAPVASLDRERNTWTSAGERFAEHRRLVGMVAATYKSCKEAPVVAAFNLDPTPGSGSLKWSPQTAEYIADVELGVRRALELKPEAERDKLGDAWERLVEDDTTIDDTQRRAIGILAPAFYRRELHPGVYFKPNRHPEKRGELKEAHQIRKAVMDARDKRRKDATKQL